MSLKPLETKIEALRAEADRLRGDYSAQRTAVEQSPNLTPEGVTAELEPLRQDISARLRQLREQEQALVAAATTDLQRRVFGTVGGSPESVISYRDAQERAARLEEPGDAQEAMRRALLAQDTGMAQAILSRALEMNWRAVITQYTQQNTARAEDIADLGTLTQFQTDGGQRMQASMHYLDV